jgi:two-component system, OmpR family, sensor histidine kinase CpxA
MRARLSFSWKIAILAIVTLVMLTGVLLIFAGVQFRISPENFIVAPALNRVLSVSGEVAQELGETPLESRAELLDRFAKEYGVDFYLVDVNGNSMAKTRAPLPKEVVEEVAQRFRNATSRPIANAPAPGGPAGLRRAIFRTTTGRPRKYWVSVPIRWRTADSPALSSAYLVVMSDSFIGNQFFFDPRPWIALTLALTVVFALVWLPLIRSLTRAITQMTHATSQIAEGQFDTRLHIKRADEVGQLASSINRMSTQLSGFVKGQKRFLADIAHELCAPLARMQMALGILEQRADERSREYVADVKDDVQHMSELIDELLSFSKAGMQMAETDIARVNVSDVVERVLERERTPGAEFRMSVTKDVAVLANPDYLVRAVSNLVRNAIRYAGNAGPISISAHRDGPDTLITVSDSGAGLPENALEEVFAPFYRLEPSRGRDTGGAGLGLAIVKACVEACKGSVRARNRQPSGLAVEIRLPTA